MSREIPGFYFDPEKNKYFKIQPNHVAPPGSQYSTESVKRKRAEKEDESKKAQLQQRRAKETVRKESFLHHPLISVGQEIGARISPISRLDKYSRAYASQMRRVKLHKFNPWANTSLSVGKVLRSPRSGLLVAGGSQDGQSAISLCYPDVEDGCWTYNQTLEQYLLNEPYRLSSLSLSQTGILLSTLDSGPRGDSFLALRMLPNMDQDGVYTMPSTVTHPTRIFTTPTFWGSAARPSEDKAFFAIATSQGLHTLEGYESRWTLSRKLFPPDMEKKYHKSRESIHTSVSAVEWISQDVIAAGLKDSAVFLHDLRSDSGAVRLQHVHGIEKIRQVDPYRLVISGHGHLQMYDLRFARNGVQSTPRPLSSRHTSTRPYLTFPEYSPDFFSDFDVCKDLNLLASGAKGNKIQLFSLKTGERISSPLEKHRYKSPVDCLVFEESGAENRFGPQTPSLLVGAKGGVVDQWIW